MSSDLRFPEQLPGSGMMDFGSSLPEISVELENNLKPLVVAAITGNAGVPHDAVCASVLRDLPPNITMDTRAAFNSVSMVLDRLVAAGEISRLVYRAENLNHVDYYPKGTSFKVEPERNLVLVGIRPSPPPIYGAEALFLKHYVKMFSDQDMDRIVLNLMAAFCPHCGRPAEGHTC